MIPTSTFLDGVYEQYRTRDWLSRKRANPLPKEVRVPVREVITITFMVLMRPFFALYVLLCLAVGVLAICMAFSGYSNVWSLSDSNSFNLVGEMLKAGSWLERGAYTLILFPYILSIYLPVIPTYLLARVVLWVYLGLIDFFIRPEL